MTIHLTKAAAQQVKTHLAGRDQGEVLRVAVKNAGCSGLAYVLDYASEIEAGDQVFETNGVKVVVDKSHLEYLQGMQIDYVVDGLSCAFHFKNPNVTEQCGCGESFTVN